MAPATRNGIVNELLTSARYPPRAGPMDCPIPKKSVTNPSAAGARRGPTKSPAVAAIMVGILHAVSPKRKADR